MEQTPTFEVAVERLKRFLGDQGWASTLVWRRETDIVRGPRCEVVVRRRSEAKAVSSAGAHYEAGRLHGVGIALATPHRLGRPVGGVRWWFAKRKASSSDAATTRVAAQPAVAADGASRRR
jgi:hypothetical protein